MDLMTQYERERALVRYTHAHHEDLVDTRRNNGEAFARGMVIEGTDVEIVSLGPDLMADFESRHGFAKVFMVAHLVAFETYARAMISASQPGVSRTFWYLARYMGRVQERLYIKSSLDATRQLNILGRIISIIEDHHEITKPVIDYFNLGTGIAIVCFASGFVTPEGSFGCLLLGFTVVHLINVFYPTVVHLLLGVMIRKAKKIVDKILLNAKTGRLTQADVNSLEGWKLYFLKFGLKFAAPPKERGYTNIAL
ncbi:uncharacterized protein NECHADRAFT_81932 [Fusarium vanettenii 77-13-4]|uniref:Uncharacterized protein n=1 Tax=Fusarium vanettenii (strain ATCC MYA-4622 / CBS 123669 / FGSC 9596 / NRRL 45880 / 77-13-4) TaxID=660122 RepID=C7ZA06_FUSV7|nr:uncharacterized protein NECHADRAFT_81932 [Fusarium vanettenii 77-13-4]EEU39188.1 predicted protein [Fusarium vanettenii 77-13-4]